MNELKKNIGQRLPYVESDEYLDGLIDRVTENAIAAQAHARTRKRWGLMVSSAAAVALLAIGISLTVLNGKPNSEPVATQADGPIDEFLNGLTDEEVVALPCYEIEEIPEY